MRTIAEDSDTALLLGVDVNRIVPLVFVISGLFAALAGVLFALNYRQVHPFMGEALGLKGISAMVVGGMGNIWGAIAGGLIIGLAEAFSIRYLRRRLCRHFGLRAAAAHPDRAADRAVRRRERGSARMSGYVEGVAGAAGDQCRLRLRRVPADRGGPAQSRRRRLRRDRRLCFGLSSATTLELSPLLAIPLGGLVARA